MQRREKVLIPVLVEGRSVFSVFMFYLPYSQTAKDFEVFEIVPARED